MTALPDLAPHHVGICVRDIDEAIAFWGKHFGFELDFKDEIPPIKAKIAFIKRNGFRLELFQVEGSTSVPQARLRPNTDLLTQGTKHLGFAVDDTQATLEKLHDAGVKIVGIMRGHGTPMRAEDDPRLDAAGVKKPAMAFFFLDPSSTLVEILSRGAFKD